MAGRVRRFWVEISPKSFAQRDRESEGRAADAACERRTLPDRDSSTAPQRLLVLDRDQKLSGSQRSGSAHRSHRRFPRHHPAQESRRESELSGAALERGGSVGDCDRSGRHHHLCEPCGGSAVRLEVGGGPRPQRGGYLSKSSLCRAAAEIMAQLGRGERWSGEFPVQKRDGTEFWAEVTDTPIRNASGEIVGIAGISQDITARKQAEQALRTVSSSSVQWPTTYRSG
jgi:PAS domain-containing protein